MPAENPQQPQASNNLVHAIKRLRDDTEGAVDSVICIVRAHEQLFRVMSCRLDAASKTGQIHPDPEIRQLGQDISQQIANLTKHVNLMKARLDKVDTLVQALISRYKSNQTSETEMRTRSTIVMDVVKYLSRLPVKFFFQIFFWKLCCKMIFDESELSQGTSTKCISAYRNKHLSL